MKEKEKDYTFQPETYSKTTKKYQNVQASVNGTNIEE